ncbi:MAG TPA: hypothetical protein VEF71_06765 [Streptosporangiaceae bacterium]|nr:hypothetical protein [Streptosporangiaceae bacterium]
MSDSGAAGHRRAARVRLASGCVVARCGTDGGAATEGGGETAGRDAAGAATEGGGETAARGTAGAATEGGGETAGRDAAGAAATGARRAFSPSLARATALRAVWGPATGGCRCHTLTDKKMSSFSANGAIRHQVRGSARYLSWELTSSGSLLLSTTGRVVSQVSTPGGRI